MTVDVLSLLCNISFPPQQFFFRVVWAAVFFHPTFVHFFSHIFCSIFCLFVRCFVCLHCIIKFYETSFAIFNCLSCVHSHTQRVAHCIQEDNLWNLKGLVSPRNNETKNLYSACDPECSAKLSKMQWKLIKKVPRNKSNDSYDDGGGGGDDDNNSNDDDGDGDDERRRQAIFSPVNNLLGKLCDELNHRRTTQLIE